VPKARKGKGKTPKDSQKGSQGGPASSAASQSSPSSANPEAATDPQTPVPVESAALVDDANTGSDSQKPKGPSPVGFVQGTKEELTKVVWPDRQQLISESAAVILMVSFLAIFISLVDNVFSWASQLVF
jgi:preprotein translocase subunit SecE